MSGINILIENLHEKLIKDINSCQLPVGIIYYVAKDVFREIELGYQRQLIQEKEQEEKDDIENHQE